MNKNEQKCLNCKYYIETTNYCGDCRKHAPVIYEEGYWTSAEEEETKANCNGDIYKYRSVTGFPGTFPDNYCGDFNFK